MRNFDHVACAVRCDCLVLLDVIARTLLNRFFRHSICNHYSGEKTKGTSNQTHYKRPQTTTQATTQTPVLTCTFFQYSKKFWKSRKGVSKMSKDYYTILGLDKRKATQEDVYKAYRKMSIRWHPEKEENRGVGEVRLRCFVCFIFDMMVVRQRVAFRTLQKPILC
jgi:hypothetical protein